MSSLTTVNDQLTPGEYPQDRCLFVLGCDRSGTTLLQNMLNAHTKIAVTYEKGILSPYEQAYFESGLDATVELARGCGLFVDDDILNDRELYQSSDERSFALLMASLYRSHAAAEGKQFWGDKRPAYTGHVSRLARLFPNSIFVHIVRDPRGVALSWEKTDWGPDTAYHAASVWVRRVREARTALEELSPHRSVTVLFEDLVASPEIGLQRICDAIGVELEPQMLDGTRRSKEKLSEKHELLHPMRSQAPKKAVAEKWREESPRVLAHIEAACYEEMQYWGYRPLHASQGKVPLSWRSYYRVLGKLRRTFRRGKVGPR